MSGTASVHYFLFNKIDLIKNTSYYVHLRDEEAWLCWSHIANMFGAGILVDGWINPKPVLFLLHNLGLSLSSMKTHLEAFGGADSQALSQSY